MRSEGEKMFVGGEGWTRGGGGVWGPIGVYTGQNPRRPVVLIEIEPNAIV